MPRSTPIPGRRVLVSGNRTSTPVSTVTAHPQIAALILDDGTVRRILMNDQLVASMPFLHPYAKVLKEKMGSAKPKSGCGGCGGSQVIFQPGETEYNSVRFFIAQAAVDQQEKIKQALNVKQLRVYYLDAAGNRARATV